MIIEKKSGINFLKINHMTSLEVLTIFFFFWYHNGCARADINNVQNATENHEKRASEVIGHTPFLVASSECRIILVG